MLWYVIPIAAGWFLSELLFRLGFGLEVVLPVCAAVVFFGSYIAPRLYIRYLCPAKTRAAVLALLDPAWPSPQGVAADFPLHERVNAVVDARDWRALRGMLTPDFAWVDYQGRPRGTKMYVCQLQNMQRMYRELDGETERVLADPYDPNVIYVLSRTVGRPHRGPSLDMTGWSRWQLAPGHEQVREIAAGGVIRVG
jgi:hypothetical protein